MTVPRDEPLSAPPDWSDPPGVSWGELESRLDAAESKREVRALLFHDDGRPKQPNHALWFIAGNCPHIKGDLADDGKTLGDTWLPWQDRATRHIYGTMDENGVRRYTQVYLEMPKKSGKSHWAGGNAVYLNGPLAKPGAEIYSAAYDFGQAMVVWDIARQMCEARGWDQGKFDIRNYQGCREIENPGANSVYEPLTRKAASKHGFNPFACFFDELHTQPKRDLWDTVDNSMGAWKEPLLMAITNSGHDRQSLCYKKREYAIQNNRDPFDDSFLGVVYGLEEEPENGVGTEDDWRRANPGVPVTVSIDKVRSKAQEAEKQPSNLNSFQRWQLGIWTKAETRWISPTDWEAAEESYTEKDRKGEFCVGGLDLGQVRDLSAWVLLFLDPTDTEIVRPICRIYCPEARLHDEQNPYREMYRVWARDGWLTIADGEKALSPGYLRPKILEDWSTFGVRSMAMDRYQGIQLSKELEQEVGEDKVAGIGQGYSSMSGPCTEFERRLLHEEGGPKIRHRGNPVLTHAVHNAALSTRGEGEKRKPTKDNEDSIIDPLQALLMALDRAMRHEDEARTSVYTHRAEDAEEEDTVLKSL